MTAGAVLVLLCGSAAAAGSARAAAGPAVLELVLSSHASGPVPLGEHDDVILTVSNSGGRASSGLSVAVAGSPAYTVTADGCSGHTLGPGKRCTVVVRFAPTSAGRADATVTVAGKHRVAPVSATLTGRGGGFGGPEPLDPETVCEALDGGTFTEGSYYVLWGCSYNAPPESREPAALVSACTSVFVLQALEDGVAYARCDSRAQP